MIQTNSTPQPLSSLAVDLALGVDREAATAAGVAAETIICAGEAEASGRVRRRGVEGTPVVAAEADIAGRGRLLHHGIEGLLVVTAEAEAAGTRHIEITLIVTVEVDGDDQMIRRV